MSYSVIPVGFSHSFDNTTEIELIAGYEEAVLGLEELSHVILLVWFQGRDSTSERKKLRVHPRGDRRNPLTGVFATRSPARPNPVGIYVSELFSIKNNKIVVRRIDICDETPVIDIKPYIPSIDSIPDAKNPDWI